VAPSRGSGSSEGDTLQHSDLRYNVNVMVSAFNPRHPASGALRARLSLQPFPEPCAGRCIRRRLWGTALLVPRHKELNLMSACHGAPKRPTFPLAVLVSGEVPAYSCDSAPCDAGCWILDCKEHQLPLTQVSRPPQLTMTRICIVLVWRVSSVLTMPGLTKVTTILCT
jgi:hypothetical protein